MGGVVDWVKYMSSPERLKQSIRNPGPKQSFERSGEDVERLFMGEPEKEPAAAKPEKTLKAVEGRSTVLSQPAQRRVGGPSTLNPQRLGRKTVLGG